MRQTSSLPSLVQKHSIMIAGVRTSISVEPRFWSVIKGIAAAQSRSLSDLVEEIGKDCGKGSLSSAIRLYVLDYYQQRLSLPHTAPEPFKSDTLSSRPSRDVP
jgi:predicted DNA-binding ribbon-helix-helix protein